MNKLNINLLLLSIADMVALSLGNIFNVDWLIVTSLLIMSTIVLFNYKNNFINLMLFFLPFAPFLKFNPTMSSFFTIISLIVFLALSFNIKFKFDRKVLLNIVLLIALTLSMKVLFGYNITFDYVMFFILLLFFPHYLKTFGKNIDFEKSVIYFTLGVICACVLSFFVASIMGANKYVNVIQLGMTGVVRFSGFYGDPNYYSAQVLAAVSAVLLLLMFKTRINKIVYFCLLFILIACGSLSVSKMFILIIGIIIFVWLVAINSFPKLLKIRLVTILIIASLSIAIIGGGLFHEQIFMYAQRFAVIDNIATLLSGRGEIFMYYMDYFARNPLAIFTGQSYAAVYQSELHGKAAHNTIIQLIYQFGIIGTYLLFIWIKQIKSFLNCKIEMSYGRIIIMTFLIIGIFISWLSLDIMFFDDFFYFIILFFLAINYVNENTIKNKPRVKKHKKHIWSAQL